MEYYHICTYHEDNEKERHHILYVPIGCLVNRALAEQHQDYDEKLAKFTESLMRR